MEKTAERLEAMFQKADSDVNRMSQRLEFEFGNDEKLKETNPAELLKSVQEVKKEYSSIVNQIKAIDEEQKKAMGECAGQLSDLCQLLQTLQTGTGMPVEKPEELSRLEKFLDIKLPWDQGSVQSESDSGIVSDPSHTSSTGKEIPEEERLPKNTDATESQTCSSESDVLQLQRRLNTNEYIEVSEQEFESVSSLIRGRVKLSEVNSTYSILWNHFKTHEQCKCLSPGEMHKMGLRVSGVTGQAKLKVLRALKLVKLSTKGDVLEVS